MTDYPPVRLWVAPMTERPPKTFTLWAINAEEAIACLRTFRPVILHFRTTADVYVSVMEWISNNLDFRPDEVVVVILSGTIQVSDSEASKGEQ